MARRTSAHTASGRHGENCIATSGTDTGGGGGGGGSPSPSGGPSSPLPGGLRRAMSGCCEERLPRNRGCERAGLLIDASGGMSGSWSSCGFIELASRKILRQKPRPSRGSNGDRSAPASTSGIMDGLGSAMYEPDHLVKLITAIGPCRAPSRSIAAAYRPTALMRTAVAAEICRRCRACTCEGIE